MSIGGHGHFKEGILAYRAPRMRSSKRSCPIHGQLSFLREVPLVRSRDIRVAMAVCQFCVYMWRDIRVFFLFFFWKVGCLIS